MAKYRHRTFEMFEAYSEAARALESKSPQRVIEQGERDEWTFQRLTAKRQANVIQVTFKSSNRSEPEKLSELRADFKTLADSLVNDSRVLLDFEGLEDFCSRSIEALALFSRKLQSKGSRLALCNLDSTVKASFFPNRPGNEGD